eukprot:TRINITY_DN40502_c0_g1_i1.p1 TRINITY_DN40502_c0_g1~~TRINITY_DN40502_c0_g1_i1.p1  ORF type:complete len:139 (+),score=30.40 TRINITY_DN40502_c0_g1_i1:2-418(+)
MLYFYFYVILIQLMCSQFFFFLMIRRPPRSTQGVSSAASDVYKRQVSTQSTWGNIETKSMKTGIILILILAGFGCVMSQSTLCEWKKISHLFNASSIDPDRVFETLDIIVVPNHLQICLLYTSPSPRDLSTSRMPSSA